MWDYPRPPRLEPVEEILRVEFGGRVIAETRHGLRLLETSHPPVYYFPPADVERQYLVPVAGRSFCEFKGYADYWALDVDGRHALEAAWSYARPTPEYAALAGHFAFYASRVDACWVGGDRARPQDGDFYGGWITPNIKGPFKGGPGTFGW